MAAKRQHPCCPTCGGRAPEPPPAQPPKQAFDADATIRLAKRMLDDLPIEPLDLVAERRRDLLRDTGKYPELQEAYAIPVRGAGGVVKWVAA